MRSVTEASHRGPSVKLIRAVIKQLGYKPTDKSEELESTLRDTMNHGAAGGVGGFTYYTETCKFYQKNKKDILALLKNQASDFGAKSVIEMVKGFNGMGDEDEENIGRVLYGRPGKDDEIIENVLAWVALEEVARAMCDE